MKKDLLIKLSVYILTFLGLVGIFMMLIMQILGLYSRVIRGPISDSAFLSLVFIFFIIIVFVPLVSLSRRVINYYKSVVRSLNEAIFFWMRYSLLVLMLILVGLVIAVLSMGRMG